METNRPSGPVPHLSVASAAGSVRACYQSVCVRISFRAFFGYFLCRSEFIVLVVFSHFMYKFYIAMYVPTMLESEFFRADNQSPP
jgi:hypothetical protein